MRVSVTTSSNLPGSDAKPGAIARITQGMKISPSTTNANSAANRTAKACSANSLSGGFAALGQRPVRQRHKGGAERALGEQAAEQIGQALGDEKSVRHRSRAEHRRGQDIAGEAEDAAHHRQRADGGDRTEQGHTAPV